MNWIDEFERSKSRFLELVEKDELRAKEREELRRLAVRIENIVWYLADTSTGAH